MDNESSTLENSNPEEDGRETQPSDSITAASLECEMEVQLSTKNDSTEENAALALFSIAPSTTVTSLLDSSSEQVETLDEEPAPISTAITTIISHFVVSADGLTKNRIDILLQLLLELSNCDDEAKTAVSALQRILFELNPQGPAEESEHIPTLVYDPGEPQLAAASQQCLLDSNQQAMEIPITSITHVPSISPVKMSEEPKTFSVESSNGSRTIIITDNSNSVEQMAASSADYDKTMLDILKSQRTQQNLPSTGASSYDLCLWCNNLVGSTKTKEHALSKHRALTFHESFSCPFCEGVFNSNATVAEHLRFIPLCSKKDIDRPITCSLCLDDFVGAGTLREHYIIFHSIGITSTDSERVERRAFWSCMYCGIAEHSKMGLSKHIRNYHDTTSPHYCRFCGIQYTTLLGMHKHLIIQHRLSLGDTLYDYYSLVCDLNFYLDTKSAKHRWCMYCDEEITDEDAFNEHVKVVHYCDARKAYLCAFCNMTFKNTDTLEKHVLNGHLLGGLGFNLIKTAIKDPPMPINTENPDNTDIDVEMLPQNIIFYLCPICSMTAHGKDHFIKSHTTEEILTSVAKLIQKNRDWMVSEDCSLVRDMIMTFMVPAIVNGTNSSVTCTLCDKTLASRTYFYFHFMETHCTKLRLQCTVCRKLYKDQTTLDLHMIRAHVAKKKAKGSAPNYVIKSMKQHKLPNNSPVELLIPDADKIVDITTVHAPLKPIILKEREQLKMNCTICDYKCVRIDHLEEHIQAKHYKKTINQCTMCHSRFSRKRDLRRHYINKHKLTPVSAREMTDMTTPAEPWRERIQSKKHGPKTTKRKWGNNTEHASEELNVMDVTDFNDSSNDNLCVINPDILDISLVGNLDKD